MALDDATALIFFGIAVAIAQALETRSTPRCFQRAFARAANSGGAGHRPYAGGGAYAAHSVLPAHTTAWCSPLPLLFQPRLWPNSGPFRPAYHHGHGRGVCQFLQAVCPGNGIDEPLYQPHLYDVFVLSGAGLNAFHSALNWAGGCNLCGGARAGQNGRRLVWRNADAQAGRGCAAIWARRCCRRRALPLA